MAKNKDIAAKREKEKEMVSLMIKLYCCKKHGTKKELCAECAELESYAVSRSEHCPFMENKTFCSNCKVHCYKPENAREDSRGDAFFRSENGVSPSMCRDSSCNMHDEGKEEAAEGKRLSIHAVCGYMANRVLRITKLLPKVVICINVTWHTYLY